MNKKKTKIKIKTKPKAKIVKKKTTVKKTVAKSKTVSKKIKKKTGYSKTELKYFKKIIEEKRKEVLDDFNVQKESVLDPLTGEYVRETSSYSMHMDFGTDSMEREKAFLLAAREIRYMENLNEALKRIEKEIFGFCKTCGKLIEKKRLEAVPIATQCIECKNKRIMSVESV